jgi:hypothetical protein
MRTFGKAAGGGRRQASRDAMPMPAEVTIVKKRRTAALVDLSSTGARLRGFDLPGEGEIVSLTLDCVRAFGSVAWVREGECGVEFEAPLLPFEVKRLQRANGDATLSYRGVEQKMCIDDWVASLAG